MSERTEPPADATPDELRAHSAAKALAAQAREIAAAERLLADLYESEARLAAAYHAALRPLTGEQRAVVAAAHGRGPVGL